MKKKLLLLLPMIASITGCAIFPSNSNNTNASNESIKSGTSTSANQSQKDNSSLAPSTSESGLIPGKEEDDPELILLYDTFYNPSSDVRITINIKNNYLSQALSNGGPYDDDHPDNGKTHDIYSPCDVTIKINNETREYKEVGIRVKGNLSRKDVDTCWEDGRFNGQLSFKLSFSTTFEDNPSYNPSTPVATLKARRFGKAKNFNIKYNRNLDQDFVKEDYANYIMREEGLLAQRMNNVKVVFKTETYTTNEFLYSAQENIDAQFLNKRLNKASQEGDLYKAAWKYRTDAVKLNNNNNGLFGVEDCTKNKYFTYNLKTNKNNSNMSNIKNTIGMLKKYTSGASQDELKATLEEYIDTDYLLKFMAMEWIISNPDSLRFNYNNTYFYFSSNNGKMYPIMYDNDRCFGIIEGWDARPFTRFPTSTKTSSGGDQEDPLYWKTILKGNKSSQYAYIVNYRNKYLDYIEEYGNKYLDVNKYNNFKSTFKYIDNKSSENLSFESFAAEAKSQIAQCKAAEGR